MVLKKYRYHFYVLLAGISYSSLSVFFALLSRQGVDAFSQVLWRIVLAALFSLFIAKIVFQKPLALNNKDYKYLIVNAFLIVFGYTTYAGAIYLGTPIAKAVVLAYSYPITVLILTYLLLKEIPQKRNLLAVILSFISLYILLEIWKVKNLLQISIGDILAWLNSFIYGGMIVWSTKMRREIKLNPFVILFYSLIFSIPLLFCFGWLLNLLGIGLYNPIINMQLKSISWLSLLGLGFFGTALPVALMYYGCGKLKSYVTSVLLLLEPIFVYIFGLVLFGQTLSVWAILGAIGILISVLLT